MLVQIDIDEFMSCYMTLASSLIQEALKDEVEFDLTQQKEDLLLAVDFFDFVGTSKFRLLCIVLPGDRVGARTTNPRDFLEGFFRFEISSVSCKF